MLTSVSFSVDHKAHTSWLEAAQGLLPHEEKARKDRLHHKKFLLEMREELMHSMDIYGTDVDGNRRRENHCDHRRKQLRGWREFLHGENAAQTTDVNYCTKCNALF